MSSNEVTSKVKQETVNGARVVEDTVERVILESWLRIGDRVMMAVPSTDEGWRKREVINGTQGTVIGFKRYTEYKARICIYQDPPGVYEQNGAAIVKWDTGEFSSPSCHDIVFVENNMNNIRRTDTQYMNAFKLGERKGDLPELPFWELDYVKPRISASRLNEFWPECERLMVTAIHYHNLDQTCEDGSTKMPVYQVEPPSCDQGRTSVRGYEIVLVERGNLWLWEHDRSKVKFKDLQEEIRFHRLIGLYKEVLCPQTGHYGWEKDHVFSGLESGIIDAVTVQQGFFGSGPTVQAFKLTDPDLSARANAVMRKGFAP